MKSFVTDRNRKAIWLVLTLAVLLPSGCASQRGRMVKKQQINTAQLLAAARQYEKEGQLQSASNLYRHVLKYHPGNNEAREGLALVQQGKLRVNYDVKQLMAAGDPVIQKNPQAREQLARQRETKREQLNVEMASLIKAAAENPTRIEVDPTPTPIMVASAKAEPIKSAAATDETVTADASKSDAAELFGDAPLNAKIAQADGTATSDATEDAQIETTAFSDQKKDETEKESKLAANDEAPADWSDPNWQQHSLTRLCTDANAAVLAEVKKLEDKADNVRKDALTKLAQLGDEGQSAAPAIKRVISDQNQLVAAHAAWAYWAVGGEAKVAVEGLKPLLGSPSAEVAQLAAYTLGNIGEPAASAVAELRKLLGSKDQITRLHAAEAVAKVGNEEQRADATDTLIVLMGADDEKVRSLAAMTLSQADEDNREAAIQALAGALTDEATSVRTAAALSLGAYGQSAQSAVEQLKLAAQFDTDDVQVAAKSALDCIQL